MKPVFTKPSSSSSRIKSNVQSPAVSKPQPKETCSKKNVSFEQIQEKAYELFLKRNGSPGNPDEDWLEAERILKG